MKNLLLVIILLLLTGAVHAGDACKYKREFERAFDVSKIADLKMVTGAGSLQLKGDDDLARVIVKARACASKKELLESLDVVFNASTETIETQIPKNDGWNQSSSIDLQVLVPSALKLMLKDSSGDASVKGVASLNMKDSSGDLDISGIAGEVNIIDSSGAMSIDDIEGDVVVTDSSGEIEASNVNGNFTVLVDSSGDIDVKGVSKDVSIKVDSSGSIYAANVGGNFTVGKDGSGGIRYDDVEGTVSLPNKR